tara:strand:+ start:228 stop:443 length:216 start_codon:yes stop_codon:yes gene_type:complete
MYTIVDDNEDKRQYRVIGGAWISKLYPGYNIIKYEHPVDAEVAKNFIESKENRQNLKVIPVKEVKVKLRIK